MKPRAVVTPLVLAAVLVVAQAVALRAMVDHDVAGSLLAAGGEPADLLLAAATMLLRLATVGAVALTPAVLVLRLLGSPPTDEKVSA